MQEEEGWSNYRGLFKDKVVFMFVSQVRAAQLTRGTHTLWFYVFMINVMQCRNPEVFATFLIDLNVTLHINAAFCFFPSLFLKTGSQAVVE